jgi:enamine deaminase RidA (YjgF/YER057c/UK114 family)
MAVLRAAGSAPEYVLKTTVHIVGIDHWPTLNRIYGELFGDCRPARTIVSVHELHHVLLVEIDAIALVAKLASRRVFRFA